MLDTGALSTPPALHVAPSLAGGADPQLRGRKTTEPEEVGQRMEALFATMLVKELRKALPNEGFFGSGPGADTFNGWLDEHLGEVLARDGALDLAGRVKVALERQPAAEGGA